jgi:hypothetical protein
MNQELQTALFSAEAVAHMRGHEAQILPLADLARGMDARIAELEGALRPFVGLELARYSASGMQAFTESGMHKIPEEWQPLIPAILAAREVLARPIQPLTPGDMLP